MLSVTFSQAVRSLMAGQGLPRQVDFYHDGHEWCVQISQLSNELQLDRQEVLQWLKDHTARSETCAMCYSWPRPRP